jgi:uncharacterized protein
MDIRFANHNTHRINHFDFEMSDPQLRLLSQQKYIFTSKIIEQLPLDIPGIYTITGGRQIGKTTLLKQWMSKLLKLKKDPQTIAFFSGELIDDHHSLLNIIQNELEEMPKNVMCYLIIDEVTYIKDWDKTIKYLADSQALANVELIITGSDSVIIREARMRFPGRRGKASQVDFHLFTLSFREFIELTRKNLMDIKNLISDPENIKEETLDTLFSAFNDYLLHGGYLTAINDFASLGYIAKATLTTYADWIRGDMLKKAKQEHYLAEILQAIIKRYNSQISWNSLATDLSIDHPKTVQDYVELLSSMDAVYIQPALLENKLTAAPKKARKIMFTDPFIFHAIRAWLWPKNNPFAEQVLPTLEKDPKLTAGLVEAIVISLYRRHFPTYYIKAAGEVDLAYIKNDRFWPIEIKWTNQTRAKDLQQIAKYKNGIILTKSRQFGEINGVKTMPLPLKLLELE